MKKTAYMVIAVICVLALSLAGTEVIGFGPGDKGVRIGGGQFGPGGGMGPSAPSTNRSLFNQPQPSVQFPKSTEGSSFKPSFSGNKPSFKTQSPGTRMNVSPSGPKVPIGDIKSWKGPAVSGDKPSFKPQSPGTRMNVSPSGKSPLGDIKSWKGPAVSGEKQLFKPDTRTPLKSMDKKFPLGDIRSRTGPAWKGQPTQGQVQDFLKLPKVGGDKTKSGLGKIGAAALGAAAGAIALDHFARGKAGKAGDTAAIGHYPGPGGHSGQQAKIQTAQHIRENYSQHHQKMFNKNWWVKHPNLKSYYWHSNVWPHYPWYYWWRPCTWGAVTTWIVWDWGTPIYYDYGDNFYYDGDVVYLDGRRIATAAEYYNQAARIVSRVPDVKDDPEQWMPLGVFTLSPDGKTASSMVMQLAVNKDGVIQGTYYNTENDVSKPVKGMVDKQSQRAIWTFADDNNKAVILETGIMNLTRDQTDVLVHFGKSRTEQWLMVRLKEPPADDKPVAQN